MRSIALPSGRRGLATGRGQRRGSSAAAVLRRLGRYAAFYAMRLCICITVFILPLLLLLLLLPPPPPPPPLLPLLLLLPLPPPPLLLLLLPLLRLLLLLLPLLLLLLLLLPFRRVQYAFMHM